MKKVVMSLAAVATLEMAGGTTCLTTPDFNKYAEQFAHEPGQNLELIYQELQELPSTCLSDLPFVAETLEDAQTSMEIQIVQLESSREDLARGLAALDNSTDSDAAIICAQTAQDNWPR